MKESKYYCKSTLTNYRGWTEKAIKNLLPKAITRFSNPYYKSVPMYLYERDVVEEAEKSELFLQEKAKKEERALKRRLAKEEKERQRVEKYNQLYLENKEFVDEGLRVAKQEEDKLVQSIKEKIKKALANFKVLEPNILLRNAFQEKFDWICWKEENKGSYVDFPYDWESLYMNTSAETTDRWLVNYARFNLVNYSYITDLIAMLPENEEYLKKVQVNIYKQIAKNYPDLEEECKRQLSTKLDYPIKSLDINKIDDDLITIPTTYTLTRNDIIDIFVLEGDYNGLHYAK